MLLLYCKRIADVYISPVPADLYTVQYIMTYLRFHPSQTTFNSHHILRRQPVFTTSLLTKNTKHPIGDDREHSINQSKHFYQRIFNWTDIPSFSLIWVWIVTVLLLVMCNVYRVLCSNWCLCSKVGVVRCKLPLPWHQYSVSYTHLTLPTNREV